MRLRNKKTGEVFDALIRERGGAGSYSLIVCDIKSYEQSKSTLNATHFVLGEYENLAELNDEWEDYKPKEPLIKDKKVRKAVRAWAEANEIITVEYDEYWVSFRRDDKTISFKDYDRCLGFYELENSRDYSIAELCGEEEE